MWFEIFLAHIPAWLVLLLFATIPAVIVSGLHGIFRRIVPAERLIPHHDVAGFLAGVAGVLYAVVLGFLVVTVWVSFDSAQKNADLEASDVAELFNFASALPPAPRKALRTAMADYAFEVRDHEWPLLVRDSQDLRARVYYLSALPDIAAVTTARPAVANSLAYLAVQQDSLTALHDLSVHRRQRLIDADSGLPAALYVALAVGAVLLLAFLFLFGVTNAAAQYTMTFLVTAMIGLLLGTIVSLDRPYGGPLRISAQAWTLVIKNNRLADFRS